MKLKAISSVLIPVSSIVLQFVLWSSPTARAADDAQHRGEEEIALPSDDEAADVLPELEDGDLRATCPAKNKVYIRYCNDPRYDDKKGTCVLKAGCSESSATYAECEKDYDNVCGKDGPGWYYEY